MSPEHSAGPAQLWTEEGTHKGCPYIGLSGTHKECPYFRNTREWRKP